MMVRAGAPFGTSRHFAVSDVCLPVCPGPFCICMFMAVPYDSCVPS